MTALEQMSQIVENRHDYARQWKSRTGGKALGYFCTYVPEELAYAAGILPLRILGGLEPQDVSEAYIPGMYCPFCRDCLAQGLLGKYEYVDGVATARSCLHIGHAYRAWVDHVPNTYHYFFNMPSLLSNPLAHGFMLREVVAFKKSLESWSGLPISEDAIRHSIEVYNTDRRLLHQLYELRKSNPPLISGADAATAVLSSMLMDKEEHASLVAQCLTELSQQPERPIAGPRLMVLGSEIHDLELLRMIEGAGANIVIDDYCMGSRYFWNEVVLPSATPSPLPSPVKGEGKNSDYLGAIAQRYLERPRCPIKDILERKRFDHILNLIRDYNVQGVLLTQQKFCDPHEFDIPAIGALLQEKGIPSYFMEMDIIQSKGAMGTRISAFLETLALEIA